MNNMNKCTTIKIDDDGNEVIKNKKQFFTLDSAIRHAKEINIKRDHTEKLVAYKCSYCHEYHIGRNGKRITPKEKEKYRKELGIELKIFGKIDPEFLKPGSKVRVVGWVDLKKIKY